MDPVFLQWLVGQTGVAGVAALALWMLNTNSKKQIEDANARTTEERTDKLLLADQVRIDKKALEDVLNRNTEAMVLMTEVMRQVCNLLPVKTTRRSAGG